MSETTAFFQDLAILMSLAGFAAVVFSRFGWPKVLGYILVGILMNAYTWGGSFLVNADSVQMAGQLGIVFLMFVMGLSFSPREMKEVKAVVVPSAILDVVVMTWLGYTVGTRAFGWSPVPSFFLGVAICDSATTLLAKVIDEMGWGNRAFSRYVLGTSVCEDILCVGAIAVATGFATGGTVTARAFFESLGILALFFISVLVFGFIFVPRLLKSVAKRKDDEALLLTLLGCCFLISFFADKYNCSLALGAFLVGIIGGSSDVRDRLGRLVEPLKAMYSALFFVSIGLLVNPRELFAHALAILGVSAVVVGGKLLNNAVASLAVGTSVKTAVQNGFGLAQTGEFAFMTALLYKGFGNGDDIPFFPIAIGVSLLTTLVNPWMIRISDPIGEWLERRQPARVRSALETHRAWIEKIRSARGSEALAQARASLVRLGVYALLIGAGAAVSSQLYRFDYSKFSVWFERHDQFVFYGLWNFLVLSFLPLIVSSAKALGEDIASVLMGNDAPAWMQPLRPAIRLFAHLATLAFFLGEWFMVSTTIAPQSPWVQGGSLVGFLVAAAVGWRFFSRSARRANQRLHEALTAEERRAAFEKTMEITVPEGVIHRFTIDAASPAIGGTVVTLNIRAKTGASVVSVVRDGVKTRNVGPDWRFRAGDTLVALGDGKQIAALKDLLGIVA